MTDNKSSNFSVCTPFFPDNMFGDILSAARTGRVAVAMVLFTSSYQRDLIFSGNGHTPFSAASYSKSAAVKISPIKGWSEGAVSGSLIQ